MQVEPVGRWFESAYRNPRARHASSTASVGSESSDEEEDTVPEESAADTKYLQNLDPKEWKASCLEQHMKGLARLS